MTDVDMSDSAAPLPLFRSKKRKLYRQRAASPSGETDPAAPAVQAPLSPTSLRSTTLSPGLDESSLRGGSHEPSIQEILRLRKLRKHRVGGVEFRVASPAHSITSTSQELVVANTGLQEQEQEEQGGLDVARRFVGQTGASLEGVDKHMMAYIDSELAKRHKSVTPSGSGHTENPVFDKPRADAGTASKDVAAERQPATLGKLHEIDLDSSTTETTYKVTNKHAAAQPKPRIGRNGKPYIPRNRNRRTSEELRRDALVEAVLHEHTIDYYEPAEPVASTSNDVGHDEAADDALAERFRREFMEVQSERNRKRPPAPPPQKTGYGPKEEEPLKGPKLGGSRAQRAKMREVMLAADKGKK